jgi:hypothetical protein
MDSIQTKAKSFVNVNGQCIAQIMAVAEPGGFRIYVAWEWEDMAKGGVFGFLKSSKLYEVVTSEAIKETANYGWDISGTSEAKKIFKNLF